MASVAPPPPRELKIGTIIDKAIGVLDRSLVPALIYLAIMSAATSAISYFAPDQTDVVQQLVGALLKFVAGVVGAYLLLEAMVRRTGLRSPENRRGEFDAFLPFLALSLLYIAGVILGFIVVILPGLIVMARWSIAQPLLIARGDRPREALGKSWELTKGNEFQILVAMVALYILPLAIMLAAGALFEKGDLVGIVVTQLAASAMSVIGTALSVGLYGLMVVLRGQAAAAV